MGFNVHYFQIQRTLPPEVIHWVSAIMDCKGNAARNCSTWRWVRNCCRIQRSPCLGVSRSCRVPPWKWFPWRSASVFIFKGQQWLCISVLCVEVEAATLESLVSAEKLVGYACCKASFQMWWLNFKNLDKILYISYKINFYIISLSYCIYFIINFFVLYIYIKYHIIVYWLLFA